MLRNQQLRLELDTFNTNAELTCNRDTNMNRESAKKGETEKLWEWDSFYFHRTDAGSSNGDYHRLPPHLGHLKLENIVAVSASHR